MNTVNTVVLFGGTGFIGTHLAQHMLASNLAKQIILVDILPPRDEPYSALLNEGLKTGKVQFVQWDVRKAIPDNLLPKEADVIFNFAAIHREPGHQPREYFETNLRGASNVCKFANTSGCSRIVFLSSISPYGASEELKDESTLPVPETPYGSSKLVAETIHVAWRGEGARRKLLIIRPGVVFGPGENGNVTRLVRSIVKGYFVYLGNKETKKAGGYVKELCSVIQFGLESQDRSGEELSILNFSLNPPATMEGFVEAIKGVAKIHRRWPELPRAIILSVAHVVDGVASVFQIKQPVNPVRVRKMFRSTNIDPKRLRELGYAWRFSIEEAFEDWKRDVPRDFAK